MTASLCEQAPSLLRQEGIHGVVSDQEESAGALVAEHCDLPFATVAAALPLNREPGLPLPVLSWPYDLSEAGLKRNRGGERVADVLTGKLDRTIADWAEKLGCAPKRSQVDCLSPFADIAQLVRGFDFPRQALPPHFHYVGTLRHARGNGQDSTLPPLHPDRPFVFASLGTLQGHRLNLFRRIAAACRLVNVQLLVAHCGALSDRQAASIDADWVVDRVDQREAVARADLVITHGGLNTVLDALEAGKPTLCLPLAFDQPGVAARVSRLGAGQVLSSWSSTATLAKAVERLLGDPVYRSNASMLKPEFDQAGGAAMAVRIIEQALLTRRPVTREPTLAAQ